ncbi:MAG: hypothetical protein ACE5K0_00385 [Candidatus Methanofastidiosia archaeon]
MLSNRVRIILLCVLFNILFEYSARGITTLSQRPLLFLSLFGIYFTFFAMFEDLMVRYRLKNYQIALFAFLYGFIPEMFLTGNLFNKTIYFGLLFLGLNLGTLLSINFFAWGILQSIVTFYFANRIQVRDWNHPRMGKLGWALCVGYQVLVILLSRSNLYRPRGTPLSYLVALILIVVVAAVFISKLSKRENILHFQPSLVMDVFAFGSVILFVILGTFFIHGPQIITSQPLNRTAVVIENLWVVFVGIGFLIYRYFKGSDVVV